MRGRKLQQLVDRAAQRLIKKESPNEGTKTFLLYYSYSFALILKKNPQVRGRKLSHLFVALKVWQNASY